MIVAGDLIPKMERRVRWLVERVRDHPVLCIPGNHEGYGADVDRTIEKAREAAAGTNVHVMQNNVVVLDCLPWATTDDHAQFLLFGHGRNGHDVRQRTDHRNRPL
jgi:hypothetical protein